MNRKLLLPIKEYPYFYLLLVSGICVYLYLGAGNMRHIIHQQTGSFHAMGTMLAQSAARELEEYQKNREALIREAESSAAQEQAESSQQDEAPAGVTEFVTYDPKSVVSPYYTDPGKIALTTSYPYETADDAYFSDAAFIGDSRTLGLYDYSGLPYTDFYCDNGFCTYRWSMGEKIMYQNAGREVLLDEAMEQKIYGKIYLMVGLNDCGYGNIENFKERYVQLLDMLHNKQPDAVIYLLANLHISKEKSDGDAVYNNDDINAHNVAIAELADGINYFYLDARELFLDEQGYLKTELTFDGVHLYADGYRQWMDYLRQHAVVKSPLAS
ncbi:MAG: hypothetical protein HFI19_09315 [Lachnospiraceae bacterium]|nr:hypothetical protein [Lachnospiraceae bacterium]